MKRCLVVLIVCVGLTVGNWVVARPVESDRSEDVASDNAQSISNVSVTAKQRFSPSKAIAPSVAVTLGGAVIGTALMVAASTMNSSDFSAGMGFIGLGITGASIVVGPSLGYFHIRNFKRAGTGLALRGGFLGAAGFFSIFAIGAALNGSSVAVPMLAGAISCAGVVLVSATIDLFSLPNAVDRANATYERKKIAWSVAPTILPSRVQGKYGYGLSVGASF